MPAPGVWRDQSLGNGVRTRIRRDDDAAHDFPSLPRSLRPSLHLMMEHLSRRR